jgi:hypothetical protein
MPAMHAKRRDEHTAQELIAALRRLHLTPADLKALIELCHEFISEDLNGRVNALKQSRDGRDLPIEILRREIWKHDPCMCQAALRFCEKEI